MGKSEATSREAARHILAVGTQADYDELESQQETYPLRLATVRGRTYWQFQGRFYWENDGLDADQVHALLVTRQQREQRRIERAQAMVAMGMDAGPGAASGRDPGRRETAGVDAGRRPLSAVRRPDRAAVRSHHSGCDGWQQHP